MWPICGTSASSFRPTPAYSFPFIGAKVKAYTLAPHSSSNTRPPRLPLSRRGLAEQMQAVSRPARPSIKRLVGASASSCTTRPRPAAAAVAVVGEQRLVRVTAAAGRPCRGEGWKVAAGAEASKGQLARSKKGLDLSSTASSRRRTPGSKARRNRRTPRAGLSPLSCSSNRLPTGRWRCLLLASASGTLARR